MPAVPRFWRRIPNRYNLIGTKCEKCDSVYFPPRSLCPNCRSMGHLKPYNLDNEGEIVSYSVINQPQKGFEDEAPYVLAIIEMDEGPRISGQITDSDPEDVEIGKEVEAVFRHLGEEGSEGIIHYGYKFKLCE